MNNDSRGDEAKLSPFSVETFDISKFLSIVLYRSSLCTIEYENMRGETFWTHQLAFSNVPVLQRSRVHSSNASQPNVRRQTHADYLLRRSENVVLF